MKHLDIMRHQRPLVEKRMGSPNGQRRSKVTYGHDQRLRMITFAQNAESKQKLFLLDFYSLEW